VPEPAESAMFHGCPLPGACANRRTRQGVPLSCSARLPWSWSRRRRWA
jgi:hypothetical protein